MKSYDLTGLTVNAGYYGIPITGVVESSKVEFGEVIHVIKLETPIMFLGRARETLRVNHYINEVKVAK